MHHHLFQMQLEIDSGDADTRDGVIGGIGRAGHVDGERITGIEWQGQLDFVLDRFELQRLTAPQPCLIVLYIP